MAVKRDNAYYLMRLERDHHAIFRRLRAGKIKSVRQACIEAGLREGIDRLAELKRDWRLASSSERDTFIDWLNEILAQPRELSDGRAKQSTPVVSPDGFLTDDVIAAVTRSMEHRRLTLSDVAKEMDYLQLQRHFYHALRKEWKPSQRFQVALRQWLTRNRVP